MRRDAGIPALGVVLHRDRLREWLNRVAPHAGISEVQSYYVRYKPGTNCLVGFRARSAGGEWTHGYVCAFARGADVQISQAEMKATVAGALGPGMCSDPSLNLILCAFPNDRELSGARRLGRPGDWSRIVTRLLSRHVELQNGSLELLRYKPERRLVLRLSGPGGRRAAIKFYTAVDYARAKANAAIMKRQDRVGVAPLIGKHGRRHILAFEWIEGSPLGESFGAELPDALAESVGMTLARLHGSKNLRADYAAQTPSLTEAVEAVRSILPKLAPRAERLALRLAPLTTALEHECFIHGDLSPEQIVCNAGNLTLLDFDRAGMGDPRCDVGRFAAKLAVSRNSEISAIENWVDRLLTAYVAESKGTLEFPREDWKAFAAAELLRLAVEPFRARQLNWPNAADRIMCLAEEWGRDGE